MCRVYGGTLAWGFDYVSKRFNWLEAGSIDRGLKIHNEDNAAWRREAFQLLDMRVRVRSLKRNTQRLNC